MVLHDLGTVVLKAAAVTEIQGLSPAENSCGSILANHAFVFSLLKLAVLTHHKMHLKLNLVLLMRMDKIIILKSSLPCLILNKQGIELTLIVTVSPYPP